MAINQSEDVSNGIFHSEILESLYDVLHEPSAFTRNHDGSMGKIQTLVKDHVVSCDVKVVVVLPGGATVASSVYSRVVRACAVVYEKEFRYCSHALDIRKQGDEFARRKVVLARCSVARDVAVSQPSLRSDNKHEQSLVTRVSGLRSLCEFR